MTTPSRGARRISPLASCCTCSSLPRAVLRSDSYWLRCFCSAARRSGSVSLLMSLFSESRYFCLVSTFGQRLHAAIFQLDARELGDELALVHLLAFGLTYSFLSWPGTSTWSWAT